MNIRKIITIILTIIITIYLIHLINLNKVYTSLTKTNPWLVILFPVGIIVSFFVKCVQWNQLLKPLKELNPVRLYPLLLLSNLSAKITPGNVGELYRGELLHTRYDINRIEAYFTVVMDKGINLLGLITLLLLSLSFKLFLPFMVVLITLFSLLCFIEYEHIPGWFKNKTNKVKKLFKLVKNNKEGLVKSYFISLLFWTVSVLNSHVLLLSYGYSISLVHLTTVVLTTLLVTMMPVTISGFGTREITLITLLSSVPRSVVVSFSLLRYGLKTLTILVQNLIINRFKFS